MKKTLSATLGLALALAFGTATIAPPLAADGLVIPQVSVLKGEKNFLSGYEPINLDGTINAVVEIPAGTLAKYEVDKDTGMMAIEQKNGKPRYVQYLGYPANYGMVPRTLLPKSKGGDGDPLDVFILGPSVPSGTVVKARAIGSIILLDAGEIDDKLILVMEDGPFANVSSLSDMEKRFPGALGILQTWLTHYKGYDKNGKLVLSSPGFNGRAATIKTIGDAVLDYYKEHVTDADRRPLDEKGNPYLYRWPGSKNVAE